MLDAVPDLADLLDALMTLIRWRLGWRYVYSPSFRAGVRASRQGCSRSRMLAELVLGFMFFALANITIGSLVIGISLGLHERFVLHHAAG